MKLDDVKKLHQKKYRSQFGYYLVEGEHLILELQKAMQGQPNAKQVTLYVTDASKRKFEHLNTDFTISVINQKQMTQISDTKTPQGAIACVPLPSASERKPPASNKRCIYLHEVQDPGNLGTIMRSLAWFGHFQLILSPNSVDPYNPKVVRASMGAIFHVPLELDVSLEELSERFERFAYLDLHGANVKSAEFGNYDCYLFGNEARGVPTDALAKLNADAFTIEGGGNIESLNVASAVSMCAYQLF